MNKTTTLYGVVAVNEDRSTPSPLCLFDSRDEANKDCQARNSGVCKESGDVQMYSVQVCTFERFYKPRGIEHGPDDVVNLGDWR